VKGGQPSIRQGKILLRNIRRTLQKVGGSLQSGGKPYNSRRMDNEEEYFNGHNYGG
jgi:hypothetical protein